MQLIEHDGKALLRRHGLAVPDGHLYTANEEFGDGYMGEVMLKAQTIAGRRGKAGLVRKVARERAHVEAALLCRTLESRGEQPVILLEEVCDFLAEYYLAIRIDDIRQRPTIIFSTQGGMEVEAQDNTVAVFAVDPLRGVYPHDVIGFLAAAGAPSSLLGAIARFAARLYNIFVAEDATLIEINPLAVVGQRLVALDAKVELDDSATPRQTHRSLMLSRTIARTSGKDIEVRAADAGVTFVSLPGEVALLTGGAGLGMAVADELADAGVMPANFVDAPGGAGLEKKIDFVFERARDPEVKAIAMYLMHTAQPLSRVVGRLLAVLDAEPPPKPLVVGLVAAAAGEQGMTVAEATSLFEARGIQVVTEIDELVGALRALACRDDN